MKVAYVAGPYRSPLGVWGIRQNIAKATEIARELWLQGYAVICPHANTAFMDGIDTDEIFLKGDLAILERCDLIVMIPGWEKSMGATAELEFAKSRGLEVKYWPATSTTVAEAASIMGRHAAAGRKRVRAGKGDSLFTEAA